LRIIRDIETARATLLRRPPLEFGELSPRLRQGIKRIFGKGLSPQEAVERIITEVRSRGDDALFDFSKRIEGVELSCLEVSAEEMAQAQKGVDRSLARALGLAAERVRTFHEACRRHSWVDLSEGGLGQIVRPLERVGIYVPGGTASYPSTVLMTAIPARVAGVSEIMLTTPPRADGTVAPATLLAASLAGVDRIFKVGGAQAIAALAYGTESIPRVDKVCGPGNLFVVLAKKMVYGAVAIDGLHGPTETVILADDSADAAICAADLLAQAEHDEMASAIMITTSLKLAKKVSQEVERQLAKLERRSIAREALGRRGGMVVVTSQDEAIRLANEYAPEHLCLMLRDSWSYLGRITNAGGIFLGEASSEALGDYIAGPSHVMPTGGTARFSSPLGIHDFIKVTSLVALDGKASQTLGAAAATIARAEGLTGHARALEARKSPPVEGLEEEGRWG